MRKLFFMIFTACSLSHNVAWAEVEADKCFVGTSGFMLANFDQKTDEPPNFYQLNFGYHLTQQDVISVEAITWRYYAPLGSAYAKPPDKYPGNVTAAGLGIAYQRYVWGNFYTAVHATWFHQKYVGDAASGGAKLGTGNQLFLTGRVGYHFDLGSGFFVEPSIAITHWPINTGLPASFQAKESKYSKYTFEPGLHLGYNF